MPETRASVNKTGGEFVANAQPICAEMIICRGIWQGELINILYCLYTSWVGNFAVTGLHL